MLSTVEKDSISVDFSDSNYWFFFHDLADKIISVYVYFQYSKILDKHKQTNTDYHWDTALLNTSVKYDQIILFKSLPAGLDNDK